MRAGHKHCYFFNRFERDCAHTGHAIDRLAPARRADGYATLQAKRAERLTMRHAVRHPCVTGMLHAVSVGSLSKDRQPSFA